MQKVQDGQSFRFLIFFFHKTEEKYHGFFFFFFFFFFAVFNAVYPECQNLKRTS